MSYKDKLAAGAAEIHKAQAELKQEQAGKLDGTIASVTREIIRLHTECLSAAKQTLANAIRIGELLHRVRASRRGKWLKWLEDNAPFSQKTAWNYMACFEKREELKLVKVTNLADAYALLAPTPRKKVESIDDNDSGKVLQFTGETAMQQSEAEPVPAEQAQPQRKSYRQVMREVREAGSDRALQRAQIKIDKELTATLQQISRQSHAAWSDFPERLIIHGNALIREGERLTNVK